MLKVDLPYPSIDDITPDRKTALLISPTYAGSQGELSAILQYVYHENYFEKEHAIEIAKTVKDIAVCEMFHLKLLAKTLINLGAPPIYTTTAFNKYAYFTTASVSRTTKPKQMLLDDILGEMQAIEHYTELINNIDNEPVKELLMRIKLDEELHLSTLKNLLKDYCQ